MSSCLRQPAIFASSRAGNWSRNKVIPCSREDGSPITVSPTAGPWDVDSSGNINQAGTPPSRSKIAKPASLGDLTKIGENLFRPLGTVRSVASKRERAVAGGYLEMSDVQPTTEMAVHDRNFTAYRSQYQRHEDP